jgi:hypothetical protein
MHRSTIQTRKRLDRVPGRRQLALCGYMVIPAFRARAHTWLTWVAFLIAERAAGRIDNATVENIQAAVDDLAYEVERGELPLSYEWSIRTSETTVWAGQLTPSTRPPEGTSWTWARACVEWAYGRDRTSLRTRSCHGSRAMTASPAC